MLLINSQKQTLTIGNKVYFVSTAKNGLGEANNSLKTPRGKHEICAKIGANLPKGTIFKSRKSLGIWNGLATDEDLILSRILWLSGIEKFNHNSKERHIYIHGTNDEKNIGKPCSQGCIRMRNNDIIKLFDMVSIGNLVVIV